MVSSPNARVVPSRSSKPFILKKPTILKYRLLSILFLLLATACSEWNTDHFGQYFQPANSLVRNYTQLVYVEYSATEARVFGPAAHLVTSTVDGLYVNIENETDSLALFVYGYPVNKADSSALDARLTIHSSRPYALYLNGLALSNTEGYAIRSQGSGDCLMVLPTKSKNSLRGSLAIESNLIVTGTGALTIHSTDHCIQAASLQCQYDAEVTLNSSEGDGIHLDPKSIKTLSGKWDITAAHHGIYSTDTMFLIGGTFRGSAQHGAFLESPSSALLCQSDIMVFSPFGCTVLDSTYVAQRFDSLSIQPIWQSNIDLKIEADSSYSVYRNSGTKAFAKFKARQTLDGPNLLISNAAILSSDTIVIRK